MILPLRDGGRLADRERRLREVATQGRNVVGSSAGQAVSIHQNSYLAWVGTAEAQLRNIFVDSAAWNHLYAITPQDLRHPRECSANARGWREWFAFRRQLRRRPGTRGRGARARCS